MTTDPFTVQGSDAKDQYEPIEAGVHQAALACIVHNPNQPGYQNAGTVNQCVFIWITPFVTDAAGAPKQVRRTLTMPANPMHERANFRKLIESWIGTTLTAVQIANFNMRKMLGRRCTLVTTVATSAQGRRYAKLTSVSKATGGAYKIPAGIVVHVTQVSGQQIIAADGVKIEVTDARADAVTQEPPPIDEDDIPF